MAKTINFVFASLLTSVGIAVPAHAASGGAPTMLVGTDITNNVTAVGNNVTSKGSSDQSASGRASFGKFSLRGGASSTKGAAPGTLVAGETSIQDAHVRASKITSNVTLTNNNIDGASAAIGNVRIGTR